MIMKTEKLEIEIRPTTRKIVNLTSKLKGKNLSEIYFKAFNDSDLGVLTEIIFTFGEKEGKNPFNNDINKVYDFIDEYKVENKLTYEDIYTEIGEMINDEGFFVKKMTKEAFKQKLQDPMSSINMEEIIRNATERVATEQVIAEFKGQQG
jgi:hypothetical protein